MTQIETLKLMVADLKAENAVLRTRFNEELAAKAKMKRYMRLVASEVQGETFGRTPSDMRPEVDGIAPAYG